MRAFWLAGFLFVGCRVGEDYHAPQLEAPEAFSSAAASATTGAEDSLDSRWWRRFGDPVLDGLVERAMAQNLDLAIAAQRIQEARAGVAIVGGEARPAAQLGAAALRREPSTSVAGGEFLPADDAAFFSFGFDARWELDLFGRTARKVEAAEAEHAAIVEEGRGTRLAVLVEVARQYLELRGAEAELALIERELASQQDTVDLVGERVRAGLEDELALTRARALLATTEAGLPAVERRRAAHVHALALLLGEWPGTLAEELDATRGAPLPEPPVAIASGLPLELLRRRPDLRASERRVAQASALSAQAVAELYPSLSLGAAFGWESERLDGLFEGPARAYSVGPSLVTPLFQGGILRWAIEARNAQQEQARLAHERAWLEALREVEDALVGWQRVRERRHALESASAAQQEALALARARYLAGLEDFLGVLDSERAVLLGERELVRERTELCVAAAGLYKALGGGWEETEDEKAAASTPPTVP